MCSQMKDVLHTEEGTWRHVADTNTLLILKTCIILSAVICMYETLQTLPCFTNQSESRSRSSYVVVLRSNDTFHTKQIPFELEPNYFLEMVEEEDRIAVTVCLCVVEGHSISSSWYQSSIGL